MIDVITRTEPLENEPLNPFGGPELRGVARALRPQSEELYERLALAASELGRTSRPGLATERCSPLLPRPLQPLADCRAADPQLARDVRLGNTLAVQHEGLETSVFKCRSISSFGHAARLLQKATIVN